MNHRRWVRPQRTILTLSLAATALAQTGAVHAQSAEPSIDPASTHVILRMQVGGGFVPLSVNLLEVPTFTLYEDGTAIFRPKPDDASFATPPALIQAQLSEAQVEALLAFAVGPGGLGDAAERYDQMFVSDAPTTTFTIDTAELTKTVSAYALGFELPAGDPNAVILGRLADLAATLGDFGAQVDAGNVESAALYEPISYLATFTPDFGGNAQEPVAWPFPDVAVPVISQDGSYPTVVLSADQVAQVTTVPSGGVGDLYYQDDSGQTFFLTIRPLLPDEPMPVDIA